MNPMSLFDWSRLQQLLGARNERIAQLEQQITDQKVEWESDAMEWRRLQCYRCDLAEWLIDGATNEYGQLVNPLIDSGLGGESFVPCVFTVTANGKRYQLALVSTDYEIREVAENE